MNQSSYCTCQRCPCCGKPLQSQAQWGGLQGQAQYGGLAHYLQIQQNGQHYVNQTQAQTQYNQQLPNELKETK